MDLDLDLDLDLDMNPTPQPIALTGAAGFIGSHLAEALLSRGDRVIGIDNFNDFYDPAVKRANLQKAATSRSFTLREIDIRDLGALESALEGCRAVIHLAAMAGVRPSLENPQLYEEVNIRGTLNLLEACRRQGVRNVVFGSSSSIYGNNRKVPFSESDPVDHPVSVYAATKKAGELLGHTHHALYGLDVTCLRYFTVYGPRQRPDLAIHKFSRRILEDRPIPVFGDGSMERDYTYIDDILEGTLAALETNPGRGFRVINLGSDRPVRLDVLIAAIEKSLGKKARIDRKPVPPGDVRRTWADLEKANRELCYRPKTSLEEGLASFARWLREDRR